MKIYFADTNVFLRFLLKDNPKFTKKARSYFTLAKNKQIRIIVLSAIILEIEYVLRKVYSQPRREIAKKISSLVKSIYFEIEDRGLWLDSLALYSKANLDLVDIFLFEKAKINGAEVLSFDQDFSKIKEGNHRMV